MIEDDVELASLIAEYLGEHGFQVDIVTDGAAAEAAIRSHNPDILILDLALPNKEGLDICRDVRGWYFGPILLLTARSGWVDEIVGLEMGADDYLGKPVEPRLLLARLRSLLRRSRTSAPASPSPVDPTPALVIDPTTRVATVGDRALDLTDAEYDLLVYFKANAGTPLSREQLTRDLTNSDYDGLGRTIDVRVSRLRTKLGDDGKHPRWIKAIRGVGYLFVDGGSE